MLVKHLVRNSQHRFPNPFLATTSYTRCNNQRSTTRKMSAIRPIMRPFRVTTPFRQPSSFRQLRITWASSFGAGSSRGLSTGPSPSSGSGSNSRRRLLYPLALLPAGLLLIPVLSADSDPDAIPVPTSLTASTTPELLRTWFVYAIISMPGVVDYSPTILNFFINSPLRGPTEWFVRHTFLANSSLVKPLRDVCLL